MTPATNRAIEEQPVRPQQLPVLTLSHHLPVLTLLEGRVKDATLVARAVAGGARGKAAEEEIYRRYRPALLRVAATFSELDADELEDVAQDSFVRAFRALPGLKDRDRFSAWLFTIARNRARSYLSSRHTHRTAAEQATREAEVLAEAAGHSPAASQAMEKEAELRAVREIIDSLREGPEKETVRLFYLDGTLSAREIAARMGVGKSAVTMRLERFRARIRAQLCERLAG
jgi:RNA polymerase sigma-70 factor (ECF subfamily)